jgi:uncharacterized protein (DUF2384 family)
VDARHLLTATHQATCDRRADRMALRRVRRLWVTTSDVLGDAAQAERFIASPHPLLANQTPLACAVGGERGLRQVLALLASLKYGTAP